MNYIKERRKEIGMTQGQLAEKIGVSQAALCSWEKGEYRPKMDKIRLLADALQVDPVEMLQRYMGLEAV